MPAPTKDVMLRTWELLKLIPQRPPGKTARQLLGELATRGYVVVKKTVERDLTELSTIFPIAANEASKPYQWYWMPNASLNLPGVAVTEAMSLVLAEDTLKGLMHKSLLAPLQARLDAAKRLLTEARGHNSKVGWADKIRSVPRDFSLRAPSVNFTVLEQVRDALLWERQLEIEYKSLGDAGFSWRLVNPRALLLKGSVMYLLADKKDLGAGAEPDALVKQYALHRIRSTRAGVKAAVRSDFNLKRYMDKDEHEVGHRHAVRVRLRVSADLAKILRETPLAPKQQVKMSGKDIIVVAAVRNTPALRRWILGHGPAVEVLGPAALKAAIRTKILAAAAQC
jgi:predicted DNA-binding transcriptional regulator YafY